MIHLAVARIVCPDASGAFVIGNFAPDFTNDRFRKDMIHLRGKTDRWSALAALAKTVSPDDPLMEGWLLHLFTDACWDEGPQAVYARGFGEGWFRPYREEIGRATFWIFHHEPWAKEYWVRAQNAHLRDVDVEGGPSVADMLAYRDHVGAKHAPMPDAPSAAFPPDLIDAFARETAARYIAWREEVSICRV